MIRLRSLIWVGFVVLAGGLVYLISHAVDDQRSRLKRLNTGILAEQDAIRVLGAEWSHLSRPERLSDLADRHTRLVNLTPDSFATADALPQKPPAAAEGEIPADGALPAAEPAVTP